MHMEKRDYQSLSVDEQLKLLKARVLDLERRISTLEQNLSFKRPNHHPKITEPNTSVKRGYLGRTISVAKRDYERKYR